MTRLRYPMTALRHFAESDVAAVVALFEKVYSEYRWDSRAACESYFRDVFFNHPWRHLDLPSWVAEDEQGVCGFAGILPRRMAFRGRLIRVAIGCQFMIEPEQRHSLTALQLLRAVVSGPQDLFISDGANDHARQLWRAIGGATPLLCNLHWTTPLRPIQHALSLLERRTESAYLARAGRPLARIADALAMRLRPNRFHRNSNAVHENDLDSVQMLALSPEALAGNELHPVYDSGALQWLLRQAALKKRHGSLRARAVLGDDRRLLGWFLYYARADAVNEVVQIAAREDAFDLVLQRLLSDAWRQGATALRGRLDPHQVQTLSDRHCWLRREGAWTLVHSRDAGIAAAIERGDAFLSRLDGEWCLRFVGC